MTKAEMMKKMEQIETRRFYLAMKDHWTRKDFDLDHEMFNEWLNLKRAVEEA